MTRHDYAFPFRIDSTRRGAQAPYADHVEQMIRQILLTDPGERVDLPEFGCGLRRLLFAPVSDALVATTRLLVQQALDKWLAGQIEVRKVEIVSPDQAPEPGQLLVRIEYVLIETRTNNSTLVQVS
ncbi:MAG TPA: GPW/gp25 family protein [Gemmataceae bacterium]|nr:GPW/gp25 family protein [Gemmataceae bacterium]